MSQERYYAVAREFEDGSLGFYTFHNSQILHCTKQSALNALNKAKDGSITANYKLYKIKLKEVE